jgi:hypothetical protein
MEEGREEGRKEGKEGGRGNKKEGREEKTHDIFQRLNGEELVADRIRV